MLFGLIKTRVEKNAEEAAAILAIAATLDKSSPGIVKDVKLREAYGQTIDADEDQWRPLTGDNKRDLSPLTQARMREVALFLWQSNLLANRLIELPLAYLLGEGVNLKATDPESQDILDNFWNDPINQMDLKLPKKVRELGLYGEQCYPAFVNDQSGHVRLGYLNPSHIATVVLDPDNPEQPIGIVTVKDRKGVAKKYRVIINGPEEVFTQRTQQIRQEFADGEAFFFTINDLSDGARGRSDLLAQADYLDGYDQFLFGELDRVSFLRAFLWDVTMKGATEEQVKERAKQITAPAPGSVRVHNDSEEWDVVSPTLGAGDTEQASRLFRNHVLGGGTIPEHWFGGGGDVNRAVGAEMGEPTFKIFSMRQKTLKYMLQSIGFYVLRQKFLSDNAKKEPEPGEEKMKLEAIFPEMTSKDTSKYAAAITQVVSGVVILIDKGLITEAKGLEIVNTIAGRLGIEIDVEEELNKAREEYASRTSKAQEADTFTTPPVEETPAQE